MRAGAQLAAGTQPAGPPAQPRAPLRPRASPGGEDRVGPAPPAESAGRPGLRGAARNSGSGGGGGGSSGGDSGGPGRTAQGHGRGGPGSGEGGPRAHGRAASGPRGRPACPRLGGPAWDLGSTAGHGESTLITSVVPQCSARRNLTSGPCWTPSRNSVPIPHSSSQRNSFFVSHHSPTSLPAPNVQCSQARDFWLDATCAPEGTLTPVFCRF